eukprot:TRINITY_DN2971_c0_g1_i2.p1 TRINITY_DN2971_c0_g1~~TRINITY_DN2971_c0_g1_i2.p1  ORF type:complete len:156 (+),score=27.74 TRINITY_DN2971_c0_g1_i2:55-468(+)
MSLTVKIVSAENLKNEDTIGLSDPYVVLRVGRHEHNILGGGQEQRTKTVNDNLNPTWNETFEFTGLSDPDPLSLTLFLHVYDEDENRRDESLGEFQLPLESLVKGHRTVRRDSIGGGRGLFKNAYINYEVTAHGWGR